MNKLVGIILFIFLLGGCKEAPVSIYDFEEIKTAGELTIITLSSSTSYFIYKDEPMGYDYDLAKDFCDFHGLKLNVKVAENSTRLLQMLANGEGDLIASTISVRNELKDSIIYCGLEQISHQVLIQRTGKKDSLVRDVTQLIDKEVYVKHDTKYHQRILNLNAELGGGIIIKDVEKDTVTVEDLIAMVAHKDINYTIADDYIAKLNKTYYRNIDILTPLSFEQRSMWVVRKSTPKLAEALNEWFSENSRKPTYRATLKKYFELSKTPLEPIKIDFTKLPKGSISVFDPLFKKYASVTGYDWALLAAIAYQESRFRTDLSSWAGAVGLMGLMPRTAAIYGVEGDSLKSPELSVMAGANYIKYLNKLYTHIADPQQRIKFVLAAYNGGHGHISDARALASKYGDNPDIWDNNVEKYIELKSKPEFYNDSIVKYGYLRGTEVVNYVSQVTENWVKFKSAK
ncbi:MAG: transporter substrate-binding domain-containing protein [Dysgonomonas sp.]|nr:transporter substrate-binding domain-containing protein [Dysgonomonas sp.]